MQIVAAALVAGKKRGREKNSRDEMNDDGMGWDGYMLDAIASINSNGEKYKLDYKNRWRRVGLLTGHPGGRPIRKAVTRHLISFCLQKNIRVFSPYYYSPCTTLQLSDRSSHCCRFCCGRESGNLGF